MARLHSRGPCPAARNGVSVQWRDGKAIFSAAAEPPPEIVALIDARKAEVSDFLHPDAVQRRLDAEADLLRAPRPPDVSDSAWQTALRGLRAFLANGHGDEAERLGWPRDELYAVPPVWSRVDMCGVGLLIGDREVFGITPNEIRVKTASGATLGIYRKPQIDYALAYRARIKSLGDDGLKEEPRLRALEAVVGLFRANNPGASIDEAKTAVLAALGRSSTKEKTPP